MPAAVWVPAAVGLLSAGVGAAVSTHNTNKTSDTAAKTAADIQAENKRIYDQETAKRKPFLDASTAALGKLGELNAAGSMMALPPAYQSPYAPTAPAAPRAPMGVGSLGMPVGQSALGSMPPAMGSGAMVKVQNPANGEVRQIPQAQLQTALSRGLKQVP